MVRTSAGPQPGPQWQPGPQYTPQYQPGPLYQHGLLQPGMQPGPQYDQRLYVDLSRNYTAAAWLCALLTALLWLPGCIAVAINQAEATGVKKRTGVTPQGYGCLIAVAVWCVLPIVALVIFFVLTVAIGVMSQMPGF